MAGTVVLTSQRAEGAVRTAVITCTADGGDATVPATTLRKLGVNIEGVLQAIQLNPGAVGPTDDYDVTLVDGDGIDRLNSVALNRDITNSERVAITGATIVSPDETLTLTIANNAVNNAVVVITLYWTPTV